MENEKLDTFFVLNQTNDEMIKENAEEEGVTIDWKALTEDSMTIDFNFQNFINRQCGCAYNEGSDGYGGFIVDTFLDPDNVPDVLNHGFEDTECGEEYMHVYTPLTEPLKSELLKGCKTDYAYLLTEDASLDCYIYKPTEVYKALTA